MPPHLPPQYGQIEENQNQYILLKRVDFPPIATLPFKGVDIEFGQDPATGLAYVRRILYPKASYARADVEAIAKRSEKCPYCISGSKLVLLSGGKGIGTYISESGERENRPQLEESSMWSKIKGFFKNAPASTIKGAAVNTITATTISGLIDATSSPLWRLLLKLGGGLALTAAGIKTMPATKTANRLAVVGMDLIGRSLDDVIGVPRAGQLTFGIHDVIADAKKLKALSMGYGPAEFIKASFPGIAAAAQAAGIKMGLKGPGPKSLAQYGGSPVGPKALIPYEMKTPAVNGSQDQTGAVRHAIPVRPLAERQVGPSVAVRKTVL